jgi:hypothetical protein
MDSNSLWGSEFNFQGYVAVCFCDPFCSASTSVFQFQRAGTFGCLFRYRVTQAANSGRLKFQRLDA